jgi:hypothetical protein
MKKIVAGAAVAGVLPASTSGESAKGPGGCPAIQVLALRVISLAHDGQVAFGPKRTSNVRRERLGQSKRSNLDIG